MRQLLVQNRIFSNEDAKEYSFNYYILVDEAGLPGNIQCESYGVKVQSALPNDSYGEEIHHITTSGTRIQKLLDLLVDNCVTPVTLQEIVEDWL